MSELEDEIAGVRAAVGELVSLVPGWGTPLSALFAFFEARRSNLRFRQLESWLQHVSERVDRIGASKLDRAWLGSEDGQRVTLALGEAALDLLASEKVSLLASAAVSSARLEAPWSDYRKQFARILIDLDLAVLAALFIFARDWPGGDWNIDYAATADQLRASATPDSLAAEIDEHILRDAVAALRRYRLADVIDNEMSGDKPPRITEILPRPAWDSFAKYLVDTVDPPEQSRRDA